MNDPAPKPTSKLMPIEGVKYRLVTRSDMDGLVCGVLLQELGVIDEVTFAHPKDMQDGLIDVDNKTITTNLPYVEGVYMAFDHHTSELERLGNIPRNYITNPDAPSAARVVYEYFGGHETFPDVNKNMMIAVDKADSADFTRDEILHPKKWVLLSFLMDARTGLGRFRDFRISNYQLMMKLIDHCRNHETIDQILELPDVKERVDLFFDCHQKFQAQIQQCSRIRNNLIVLDLRKEDVIWAGNRFVIYALFPQCNISMHIMWGRNKQNTVAAIGKSILNRTSKTNIGKLCLKYGGGGHSAAGTCQLNNNKADDQINEIIARITSDG